MTDFKIPPITDPLGSYWKQPETDDFLIDDTHVIMTLSAFNQLLDYSRSMPTGVYPGKAWKSKSFKGTWWLRWFGLEDGHPEGLPTYSREILIA